MVSKQIISRITFVFTLLTIADCTNYISNSNTKQSEIFVIGDIHGEYNGMNDTNVSWIGYYQSKQ